MRRKMVKRESMIQHMPMHHSRYAEQKQAEKRNFPDSAISGKSSTDVYRTSFERLAPFVRRENPPCPSGVRMLKVARAIMPSGAPCMSRRMRKPNVIMVVKQSPTSPMLSAKVVVIKARRGNSALRTPARRPPHVDEAIIETQGMIQIAMILLWSRDFWPRMKYMTPNAVNQATQASSHHRPYRAKSSLL